MFGLENVALEKLISCCCRHTIDFHDDFGCQARVLSEPTLRCRCALRPRDVVEQVIALELEATRRRWFGDDTPSALDDL
ncbi:MAG: hypothetical protein JO060_05400 [Candidatus Eremiobacteraeota bacterium]|nr:hypothetical protein [Candidatus Eremiobacteraeota bacterium]